MAKLAKTFNGTAIILIFLGLGACTMTNNSAHNKRLWRIEQNAFGYFAYCQTGIDCPERTQKTLASRKPSVPPTQLPAFDQSKVVAQVYFGFGKAALAGQSINTLKRALPQLKSNQRIILRGWTDPVSGKNSAVNQKLARQRAQNVKSWLVKKGIKASVIKLESEPPCCNNPSATAKSPDAVRSKMRTVTIEIH